MAEAVLIVFFLVFGGVTVALLITRARTAEAKLKAGVTDSQQQNKALEAIVAETQAEVSRLKERVIVLERLATDDDRKLADEIERLRRGQGPEARS